MKDVATLENDGKACTPLANGSLAGALALIDRGGRELPIQADYVVRSEPIDPNLRVDVIEDAQGLRALVQANTVPTTPPARP